VAMAGREGVLAVVWVEAPPSGPAPGAQNLAFALYDVEDQSQLARGRLPLGPPGSTLTWLGFTEEVRKQGNR
jgi:hypothetical protein